MSIDDVSAEKWRPDFHLIEEMKKGKAVVGGSKQLKLEAYPAIEVLNRATRCWV